MGWASLPISRLVTQPFSSPPGFSVRPAPGLARAQHESSDGVDGLIEARPGKMGTAHHPVGVDRGFLVVMKVSQNVQVIRLAAPE